jgi:predicted dehydrogenase
MQSNNLKVGIIGAGRMGRRHIHVVRKLGFELVGIVDVSRDALQEARREHDLDSDLLFDSPENLYASVVPGCLIIATTADSHCTMTCNAAKWGTKYILVEKPMAVSLDECKRMIRTCETYGAKLAVNHQMRFMEQYSKPKAMLESDEYGGFKSMTVVGGNFGFSMNGTHYIEAFRYITGEEPAEITGWFSPDVVANPRGVQFEDRAGSIRVVTTSGKRLYIEIGSDQGHGLQVTYAGRNGIIGINELTGEMTTSVREPQYRELPTTRYGMPAKAGRETIKPVEVIDSTAKVLSALLNDQNSVTAQQGMLAVKVLVAAYTSAENGSVAARLDHKLDHSRVFPWA